MLHLLRSTKTSLLASLLFLLFSLAVPGWWTPAYAASASITLSPTSGPPTTSVTVTGQGFAGAETIVITFDSTPVATALTNQQGSFSVSFTVPSFAAPGKSLVQATGRKHGHITLATNMFLVQTNWPLAGFNPQRTYFNPYENVLDTNDVAGLQSLWTYNAGYILEDSPIFSNGLVYINVWGGDLDALDAQTGVLKWQFPTGINHVAGAPAVVNGLIYFGTGKGYLFAMNAKTGAEVWSHNAGLTEFDGSPTVANGIVYFVDIYSALYALNATTGALLWSTQGGPGAISVFSSPAVDNNVVYAAHVDPSDGVELQAFNAQTGTLLWISFLLGDATYGFAFSPTVVNGLVYIGSSFHGSETNKLYALNAQTGAPVWSYPIQTSTNQAVANDYVYIGGKNASGAPVLDALDAHSGQLKWSYSATGDVTSSPAVANGVVYSGSWDHKFFALDAQTGTPLLTMALAGAPASPTIVNGDVYVGENQGDLVVFHLPGATT